MTFDPIKIYNDLMNLVAEDEAFFFKDFMLDDVKYRIFNYRLASWTSFQKPSALYARGIMYDVTDENNVVLKCQPPMKFFNFAEGSVDHTSATCIMKMEKLDGSLISTYWHKGHLRLKTKGSLFSEQAIDAMKWLDRPENAKFKFQLSTVTGTVNLEITSPRNRIVIPYAEEKLTVLNVCRGEYFFVERLGLWFSPEYIVNNEAISVTGQELTDMVSSIEKETVGEGYVLVLQNESGNYMVKVKNDRYIQLHHTKDSITSQKRLFECVVDESTDDLKGMFSDDPVALQLIDQMEQKVIPIFNHLIKTVETFYEENKELSRKDYALKAKAEHPTLMGLLMNPYIGRENDYKDFAKKNRVELFNVNESVVNDAE